MDKQNVMKALERCSSFDTCGDCPYRGMDHCEFYLCADALALLKSANKTVVPSKPTYHTAYTFTKHDNLSKWFNTHLSCFIADGYSPDSYNAEYYYAQERDVQLILLVRHETVRDDYGDNVAKCYCKIKCPINPLPIKGEFEAVTAAAVGNLLKSLGWHFKEKSSLILRFINKQRENMIRKGVIPKIITSTKHERRK